MRLKPLFLPSSNRPLSTNANRLLAGLGRDDYHRIAPTLAAIPLTRKDVLYTADEPIQHVYFPDAGFCSIITTLRDGSMVEVVTVGRGGVIGIEAAVRGGRVSGTVIIQGDTDTCHRMTADAFRREMDQHGRFYELLTRYAQTLMRVVMQSAACHAAHSVQQRLARWLLTAHDRMEADEFAVTQECLAMMLNVARPAVSIMAGTHLVAAPEIYDHGRLVEQNRSKGRQVEGKDRTTHRHANPLHGLSVV